MLMFSIPFHQVPFKKQAFSECRKDLFCRIGLSVQLPVFQFGHFNASCSAYCPGCRLSFTLGTPISIRGVDVICEGCETVSREEVERQHGGYTVVGVFGLVSLPCPVPVVDIGTDLLSPLIALIGFSVTYDQWEPLCLPMYLGTFSQSLKSLFMRWGFNLLKVYKVGKEVERINVSCFLQSCEEKDMQCIYIFLTFMKWYQVLLSIKILEFTAVCWD